MTGSPSMPGLTPKAIDELFRLIAEKPQLTCKVRSTPFYHSYLDVIVCCASSMLLSNSDD